MARRTRLLPNVLYASLTAARMRIDSLARPKATCALAVSERRVNWLHPYGLPLLDRWERIMPVAVRTGQRHLRPPSHNRRVAPISCVCRCSARSQLPYCCRPRGTRWGTGRTIGTLRQCRPSKARKQRLPSSFCLLCLRRSHRHAIGTTRASSPWRGIMGASPTGMPRAGMLVWWSGASRRVAQRRLLVESHFPVASVLPEVPS
jgi:hypothetical protein